MQTLAEWNYPVSNPMKTGIWKDTEDANAKSFSNDWLLHLAKLLQTSLHVDQLIEAFANECRPVIHYGGLTFQNEKYGFSFRHGKPARHSCSYTLVLSEELLGELVFMRSEPFCDEETARLEFLSSHLVYPLRNALMYHQALLTASKDPLTGSYNRSALDASLERETSLAHRHDTPLTVMMLDLDHFKKINDIHGHMTGDRVLKTFVETLNRCVRNSDQVFRYGGEEFTLLLRNTNLEGAKPLAERIRREVEGMEVIRDGATVKATVSMGVTQLENDDGVRELMERADKALYQSKANGRNKVTIGA